MRDGNGKKESVERVSPPSLIYCPNNENVSYQANLLSPRLRGDLEEIMILSQR